LTSAERETGGHLSIGAVLAALRPDVPDVTISKIRFLESEGLVHPRRTAAGYRQFSHDDVSRLRFVLAAQRDQYLPLKVIKEQLDAVDSGAAPAVRRLGAPGPNAAPADGLPTAEDFAPGAERRLTREQLLADGGISPATLAELEQYGLVRPGAAGFYDPDAVLVARTVRQLVEFGLEPRHLRSFRAAADREIGLLSQLVAPLSRQRDPDARQRAGEVARELAALCVRLHALLVKAGLRSS
jgi:DNA-binding transcriptional MerR regulator